MNHSSTPHDLNLSPIQRKRIDHGRCPIHGRFMGQIGYDCQRDVAIVGCSRDGCRVTALACSSEGPWELLTGFSDVIRARESAPPEPTQWAKVNTDLLNDPTCQRLPAEEFRRQFEAALRGEANAVSPFIRIYTGRLPAHEWAVLRTTVFQRDGYTCQYCGSVDGPFECDHVVPVSRGGTHEEWNLVTACRSCNRSKHDKSVGEWRR